MISLVSPLFVLFLYPVLIILHDRSKLQRVPRVGAPSARAAQGCGETEGLHARHADRRGMQPGMTMDCVRYDAFG